MKNRRVAPLVMLAWLGWCGQAAGQAVRPDILVVLSDDQTWSHLGAAGDPVVRTPHMDRIAREGVRFSQFHVSAPSCSPSRASILTGRHFWELGQGSTLWTVFPGTTTGYPQMLRKAGYVIGCEGKGWGPGKMEGGADNLAGPAISLEKFLDDLPPGSPFCFWFGSNHPHRPYAKGSGAAAGLDPAKVKVPRHLPPSSEVKHDMLDYYHGIESFDAALGARLQLLERSGRLQNTVIVLASDNGMPFPRSKANLYDHGTRVPLIIRWPQAGRPGRVIDDFVQAIDLAPTLLEGAGVALPASFRGKSLVPILASDRAGRVDPDRGHALFGLNRHAWARDGNKGYPMRGIRTRDYLYIRNFLPERWPAGNPPDFFDIDPGPAKTYLTTNRSDALVDTLFRLATDCRPGEELYDLRQDPDQLFNVAARPGYQGVRQGLWDRLRDALEKTGDPAIAGQYSQSDGNPWSGAVKAIAPVGAGPAFTWRAPFDIPLPVQPEDRPGHMRETADPAGFRDAKGRFRQKNAFLWVRIPPTLPTRR